MINVTRTIHPVGQGLFCTEKFHCDDNSQVFNVVYDCGSFNHDALSAEIKKTFDEEDVIDVVFISHFHHDHICGIPELRRRNQIVRIIMPQLSQGLLVEAITYNILYATDVNANTSEVNDLLLRWYFHGQSDENLCIVESSDRADKELSTYDITNLPHSISHASIQYNAIWEYVPFCYFDVNPYLHQFANTLLNTLQNDVNFQIYFANFTEDAIRNLITAISTQKSLLKRLQAIYNQCAGHQANRNANEYSMPVYSGPIINAPISINCHTDYNACNRACHAHCHTHCHVCCDMDCCLPYLNSGSLANCLYTGDFNANPDKQYYQPMVTYYCNNHRWERIKMIQVPHHGSKYNHNIDLYQERCWAFISCGLQNRYHHPHGTCVADIFNVRCHCSIVNEYCQPLKIEIRIH